MSRTRTAPADRPPDRGAALIVTLMVMAILTALSSTIAVLTINNLHASKQAEQAGAAVNAADAGISQAVSYLRTDGVRGLRCSPTCATNRWGNSATPTHVSIPGEAGQAYDVWIEPVAAFPANDPAKYRIHSTGTADGGALRSVTADVTLTTTPIPKGVFARSVDGGGTADVQRLSIFTTGCVYSRSKINFASTIDAAYGIPAAVHSSQIITDANGTGQFCPVDPKAIHRQGSNRNLTPRPCNTAYPYDQDRLGGSLVATSCANSYSQYQPQDLDGDGKNDVNGSFLRDDATLFDLFGIRQPVLTPAQVDELRTIAQSQGNYWETATGWPDPDDANAVMFFDLDGAPANRRTVDLNDVDGFSRATNLSADSSSCPSRSLVIVIEGGNARLNSNQSLYASLFLLSGEPYGQVLKANGTSTFVGTIFADGVDLSGTTELSLDGCFLDNLSPSLFDLQVTNYRELDR